MTETKELNGCMIQHSKDHRQARLVPPKGAPQEFAMCKRSTGYYKAMEASKSFVAATELAPSPDPASGGV